MRTCLYYYRYIQMETKAEIRTYKDILKKRERHTYIERDRDRQRLPERQRQRQIDR